MGRQWLYCLKDREARASTAHKTMTRTDSPLYGDLAKLNDGALAFAFSLCQHRQHLPEYAEAFKLIQAEDARRWNNGGKAQFQAMLIREFGDRAIQL